MIQNVLKVFVLFIILSSCSKAKSYDEGETEMKRYDLSDLLPPPPPLCSIPSDGGPLIDWSNERNEIEKAKNNILESLNKKVYLIKDIEEAFFCQHALIVVAQRKNQKLIFRLLKKQYPNKVINEFK